MFKLGPFNTTWITPKAIQDAIVRNDVIRFHDISTKDKSGLHPEYVFFPESLDQSPNDDHEATSTGTLKKVLGPAGEIEEVGRSAILTMSKWTTWDATFELDVEEHIRITDIYVSPVTEV